MTKKRSNPLDALAEELTARANEPMQRQTASKTTWELHQSSDASTCGDYPQVVFAQDLNWGDSDGLTKSGYPPRNIPELKIQRRAKWTDILSSQLWRDGILMTYDAAEVFKTASLGNFRSYNVTVLDRDSTPWSLCYLYFKNKIPLDAIDYGRSSFLLVDIVSESIRTIKLKSDSDFEEKTVAAREGTLRGCERFSRIAPKRIHLRPECYPSADIFSFARFGPNFYISDRLANAIEERELSGVDICENRILAP